MKYLCALVFENWKTKFGRVVRDDSITTKLMTGIVWKKKKKKKTSGTVKVTDKSRGKSKIPERGKKKNQGRVVVSFFRVVMTHDPAIFSNSQKPKRKSPTT